VPTYNNAGTLGSVLKNLQEQTSQIIVVNDGSTDGTLEVLSQFPDIKVISYLINKGKGWALRTGFKKAVELGFENAITIDSDGQHFAEDIPKFLDHLEQNQGTLIIGKRNMNQEGIPGKSSFGNNFSNFWYWVETGYKMDDTQCGFRLYPIKELSALTFFTKKFEFEIEVIVRAAWHGIKISSVPIKIHYEEKSKRVSHFRPFRDFTRISVLNTVLVSITFLYIWPRDLFRKTLGKDNRKKLIEQLFHPGDSHLKKATSIGFGVFMGIIPIWGFQLVTAILLALLFRMNKALVIVAANISIPPFIPLILYLSHLMGKVWMGTEAKEITFSSAITFQDIQSSFVQYIFGAITLSLVAGLLAGVSSWLLLKLLKKTQN
jgi:glycosyltransferase involved in cell wall biosynthesis